MSTISIVSAIIVMSAIYAIIPMSTISIISTSIHIIVDITAINKVSIAAASSLRSGCVCSKAKAYYKREGFSM
jgi:hypothetical protein